MFSWSGIFRTTGQPVKATELAHTLTAIDLAVDAQPVVWARAGIGVGILQGTRTEEAIEHEGLVVQDHWVVQADARIDNRDELLATWGLNATDAAGFADADYIWQAYLHWGEACAEHLIGDYAFVIWDAREQRLFAACDHIGARSLFYHADKGVFACAADIRSVLACREVDDAFDEDNVLRLLNEEHPSVAADEATFWRQVKRLPFGHCLRWDASGAKTWRYWRPEDAPEIRCADEEEYVERTLALVTRAVDDRLRVIGPVGAHISGGLDSSSVALLTARRLRAQGQSLRGAYSWSPPPQGDVAGTEWERIQRICEAEHIQPEYCYSQRPRHELAMSDTAHFYLQTTMHHEFEVQHRAAAAGVRWILSGWGGDEWVSFNGRGVGSEYLLKGQWRALARFLRPRQSRGWYRDTRHHLRGLWWDVLAPMLPSAWYYGLRRKGRQQRGHQVFVHPARAAQLKHRPSRPTVSMNQRQGPQNYQIALWQRAHVSTRMESWAAFGRAHGLNYAYPLTDRRLMTFCLGLPGNLYFQQGLRRYLFRRVTDRMFPRGVSWTPVKQDVALMARHREHIESPALQSSQEAFIQEVCPNGQSDWIDIPALLAANRQPGKASDIAWGKIAQLLSLTRKPQRAKASPALSDRSDAPPAGHTT